MTRPKSRASADPTASLAATFVCCERCQWLFARSESTCPNCGLERPALQPLGTQHPPLQSWLLTHASAPMSGSDSPRHRHTPDDFALLDRLNKLAEALATREAALSTAQATDLDPFYRRCGQRALLLFQSTDALWARMRAIVESSGALGPTQLQCVLSQPLAKSAAPWTASFTPERAAAGTEGQARVLLLTQRMAGETVEALEHRLSAQQRVVVCVQPTEDYRLVPHFYELLAALSWPHVGSRRSFVRELGIEKHHTLPRSLSALREVITHTCLCTNETFATELLSTIAEYASEA